MSDSSEAQQFVDHYKNLELKRQVDSLIDFQYIFISSSPIQSCITCMQKLNKNSADDDALNCLVIGTEDQHIYIVETEAFTTLATVNDDHFDVLSDRINFSSR